MNNCPVYVHLPWLKILSVRHESKIEASEEKCLFAVEQRVIFASFSSVQFSSVFFYFCSAT